MIYDLKKYKGFNPKLFEDSSLTEDEKIILIRELELASYGGNNGCFIIYNILLAIILIWIGVKVFSNIISILSRFVLIPIFLLMFFGFKFGQGFRTSKQAGYVMRKDWRKPIIYFRSFKDDNPGGIDEVRVSIYINEMATFKYSIQNAVRRRFSKFGPLIGLTSSDINNTEENKYQGANQINPLKSYEWKFIAVSMIKISRAVVFGVGELNENIKWELQQSFRYMKWKDIYFFVSKETSSDNVKGYLTYLYKEFKCIINEEDMYSDGGSYIIALTNNEFSRIDSNNKTLKQRFLS